MSSITHEIKRIIEGYLNNAMTTTVISGTYQADGSVKIDQKLTLFPSMVIIPEHIKKEGLAPGAKLSLIRHWGGQQYTVVGKV